MITSTQKESAAGSRQLTRPVFLPYARRHNRLILDQSWTESVRSQASYKHCGEHSRIEECDKEVAIRARPIKASTHKMAARMGAREFLPCEDP